MLVGLSSAELVLTEPNCGQDRCSPQEPCANGYGDCDNDYECANGNICLYDVGLQYGCPRWVDVCGTGGPTSSTSSSSSSSTTTALSTTSTIAPYLPNCDLSRCLASSPCENGFGDCDGDSGCINGSCVYDAGLQYGCPRWVDICVFNSQASFTSSSSSSSSSMASSSSSSSLPNVYGCRVLSVPDREYTQRANIQPNVDRGGGCIVVNGSNITLDCQSLSMVNDSFTSAGVYSNQDKTTIKNCNISVAGNMSSIVIGSLGGAGLQGDGAGGGTIEDYVDAVAPGPGSTGTGYGIYFEGANNSRIYGSTLKYQAVGIYLGSTYYTVIENNTLFNNTLGIMLVGSSYNNLSRTNVATLMNGSLIEWDDFLGLFSTENSLKSMLLKDSQRSTESADGEESSEREEKTFDEGGFVDVDALMDAPYGGAPYGSQIKDVASLSLIGITIINQSTHNTLSTVTVNNSILGIIIGRNSDYNTLSNTRVNIGLLGITIGNSSHTQLSTVTTLGNLLGILVVRNSSHTNMSTVVSSIGLLGITFGVGSDNTLNNVVASYNLLGIGLYANDYNNLTNIKARNNTLAGLGLYNSAHNLIKDSNLSENGYYDFILGASSNEYCVNTLDNVSSSGGRMIAYYNSSVLMSNNVLSELVLCGADYSVLNNITIAGSNALGNNGLFIIRTNRSNITNINSSGNYFGVYMISSSRNLISNLTVNNNSEDGIYMDSVGYNRLSNITALYNDDDGLDIGYGNYYTISDVTANYNWDDGIYLYRVNNTNISGVTASYNYDGVYLSYSYHNTLLNSQFNNNSNDGVSLYSSSHNSHSGLTMRNNSDYGIQLYYGVNNTFSTVTSNDNQGGVFMSNSSNNTFRETGLVNNASRNLYVTSDSRNIVMLNSTYNTSWEQVVSNSQLTRKWYLNVYVNYSNGNPFENANVSAWNVYGTFVLNATTGANGFIPTAVLSEYINNGSRYYYNNYTLSAYKRGIVVTVVLPEDSYYAQNKSINISNNLMESLTMHSTTPT